MKSCFGDPNGNRPLFTNPHVSQEARELSINTKKYLETKYRKMYEKYKAKEERSKKLEETMATLELNDSAKFKLRDELSKLEVFEMRQSRYQMTTHDFVPLKVIGKGSFGKVRLVKRKSSGQIYAMKTMSKSIMIEKKQVTHVRAEKEILENFALLMQRESQNEKHQWLVELYYSFHDQKNLYLVMEFLPGGDLMNLLIKENILPEEAAKFYTVEAILAVQSVHDLGFIHRDLKPDNLLLDWNGHLKLSDLGLSKKISKHEKTGLDFLMKETQVSAVNRVKNSPFTDYIITHNSYEQQGFIESKESRSHRTRNLAYSTVGTPDYISPEVLGNRGYGAECDWWSLGVIVFECVCGYPIFYSENRQTTCRKILNWRKTFSFPKESQNRVSPAFFNFVSRLICDPCVRLGCNFGIDDFKNHRWLNDINFDTIHKIRAPFGSPHTVSKDAAFHNLKYLDPKTDRFGKLVDEVTKHFDQFPNEKIEFEPSLSIGGARRRHKIGDTKFLGYTFRKSDNLSEKLISSVKRLAENYPVSEEVKTRPRSNSFSR
eukprot:maker-scaffold_7-snap-gene-10.25-mRNA-1 protein AED:0.05 eAED:0.05 QI:48/1/1/1/0.66/0.5/4/56/544